MHQDSYQLNKIKTRGVTSGHPEFFDIILYVEEEFNNVTVVHNVFLAFTSK